MSRMYYDPDADENMNADEPTNSNNNNTASSSNTAKRKAEQKEDDKEDVAAAKKEKPTTPTPPTLPPRNLYTSPPPINNSSVNNNNNNASPSVVVNNAFTGASTFNIGSSSNLGTCPKAQPRPLSREALVWKRYREVVANGEAVCTAATNCVPELQPLLDDLKASVKAYANADRMVQGFGEKTVMSDGNHAVSGTDDARLGSNKNNEVVKSDKYVYQSPDAIRKYCAAIRHVPKEPYKGAKLPPDFYVCHADKQLALHYHEQKQPMPPLGDSRMMCEDCFQFFRKHVAATGQRAVVTDPVMTRVIEPDGTVVKICHTTKATLLNDDLRNCNTTPIEFWTVERGYVLVESPDGKSAEYVVLPNCSKLRERFPDFTNIEYHPGGSRTERRPDGRRIEHRLDNSRTEHYGVREQVEPGKYKTTFMVAEYAADGTKISEYKSQEKFQDGTVVNYAPDGSVIK